MRIYELENNNKIIVQQGSIAEQQGDILLCWTAIGFKGGSDSFYEIHKKAGGQLSYATLLFHQRLKMTDCISTIPGLINFNLVIHSIIPEKVEMYNMSFFNIINTLKIYKQDGNVCRNLYLDIPTTSYETFLENFLLYTNQLTNFSFIFSLNTEKEYQETTTFFDKKFPIPFFKLIVKRINAYTRNQQEKFSKSIKRIKRS